MTRIIGIQDVAQIVDQVGLTDLLDELTGRLRTTLAGYDADVVATQDRTGFHYDKPDLGLVEWMPAMETGRRVSMKTVGYHPTNPTQRGTPSVLATTSVHDTTDGRLLYVCEATVLTALRTGAASAIATEVLAHPDSTVLGQVGCGAQAVSQIHAISRVRPIDRVLAFDTSPEVAATLERRLRRAGIDLTVTVVSNEHVPALVAEADVLCTATTVDPGAGPVIPEVEHRPWLHINAVGADFPGKLEIPVSYLDRALVCPDVPAQCLVEGEAQQMDKADLGPDLAEVVRNGPELSRHQQLLTVFDSTGWALEDLVAVELIAEHAEHLGIGTMVDLLPTASDPYDPYAPLRPSNKTLTTP